MITYRIFLMDLKTFITSNNPTYILNIFLKSNVIEYKHIQKLEFKNINFDIYDDIDNHLVTKIFNILDFMKSFHLSITYDMINYLNKSKFLLSNLRYLNKLQNTIDQLDSTQKELNYVLEYIINNFHEIDEKNKTILIKVIDIMYIFNKHNQVISSILNNLKINLNSNSIDAFIIVIIENITELYIKTILYLLYSLLSNDNISYQINNKNDKDLYRYINLQKIQDSDIVNLLLKLNERVNDKRRKLKTIFNIKNFDIKQLKFDNYNNIIDRFMKDDNFEYINLIMNSVFNKSLKRLSYNNIIKDFDNLLTLNQLNDLYIIYHNNSSFNNLINFLKFYDFDSNYKKDHMITLETKIKKSEIFMYMKSLFTLSENKSRLSKLKPLPSKKSQKINDYNIHYYQYIMKCYENFTSTPKLRNKNNVIFLKYAIFPTINTNIHDIINDNDSSYDKMMSTSFNHSNENNRKIIKSFQSHYKDIIEFETNSKNTLDVLDNIYNIVIMNETFHVIQILNLKDVYNMIVDHTKVQYFSIQGNKYFILYDQATYYLNPFLVNLYKKVIDGHQIFIIKSSESMIINENDDRAKIYDIYSIENLKNKKDIENLIMSKSTKNSKN